MNNREKEIIQTLQEDRRELEIILYEDKYLLIHELVQLRGAGDLPINWEEYNDNQLESLVRENGSKLYWIKEFRDIVPLLYNIEYVGLKETKDICDMRYAKYRQNV